MTVEELVAASKEFNVLTSTEKLTVQTYLLAVIAGVDPNPTALLANAKCFCSVSPSDLMRMQVYLLNHLVTE